MNKLYFLIFIVFMTGCKNQLINYAFERFGIYDDQIKMEKLSLPDKEIVFLPIHHLGTKKFYENVNLKIDSLKNEKYFFYYEGLSNQRKNDTILIKFRKISRIPLPEKGYKFFFDSTYANVKFKKPLIDQPTYEKLGLYSSNSINGDATIEDVVEYYENKFGKLQLNQCDYNTSPFEKYSTCKEKNKVSRKKSDAVILDARNEVLFKKITNSSHDKIAVIFGSEHLEGFTNLIKKK